MCVCVCVCVFVCLFEVAKLCSFNFFSLSFLNCDYCTSARWVYFYDVFSLFDWGGGSQICFPAVGWKHRWLYAGCVKCVMLCIRAVVLYVYGTIYVCIF